VPKFDYLPIEVETIVEIVTSLDITSDVPAYIEQETISLLDPKEWLLLQKEIATKEYSLFQEQCTLAELSNQDPEEVVHLLLYSAFCHLRASLEATCCIHDCVVKNNHPNIHINHDFLVFVCCLKDIYFRSITRSLQHYSVEDLLDKQVLNWSQNLEAIYLVEDKAWA